MAEFCPTCHLPMTKFSDGYRCMNYRAPEHADVMRRTSKRPQRRGGATEGGKRKGAGRKPKDKDK